MKKYTRVFAMILVLGIMLNSLTVVAENDRSDEKILTEYFKNNEYELTHPLSYYDFVDAFLADVDNDKKPELVVANDLYLYGVEIYKVIDGTVQKTNFIGHGRGTGIHGWFDFLMYDDGSILLHQAEIFDNGMTGSDWYSGEHHALYNITAFEEERIVSSLSINETNAGISYSENFDSENMNYIAITKKQKDKLLDAYLERIQPYIVFSTDDENVYREGYSINKIWDIQKQKYQQNKITVLLDGNEVTFDQSPIVINNRTLLPVRAVIEAIGGVVTWHQETSMVELSYNSKNIKLIIDSNIAYLNEKSITIDVAPIIFNGRTMLPIRFIAESFGFNVGWNEQTQTVIINSNNTPMKFENVTENISNNLLEQFNEFVCAEVATSEVAPYNIVENYNCHGNNDIREIMWHFMTDYASSYLRNIPGFYMFDDAYTEYIDYSLMRTQSYILDMVIKEYYNISQEIPKFEKVEEYGPGSLYYSNYYYFAMTAARGSMYYETLIDSVYDIGDNKYYFVYRICSGDPGTMIIDSISEDTYYAVMQRKTINNESFSNLSFWSVIRTDTKPIYTTTE